MMGTPLILDGTIDEIEVMLTRILDIVEMRKVSGWPLYQKGEKWLYITNPSAGVVCPTCESYEGRIFDGEEVLNTFDYKEGVGDYVTLPHTHLPDLSQFADTPCNCEMILQNPAEVMEMRLHEDKVEVLVL